MANSLNEMNASVLEEGHDINVIAKQLEVTVGIEAIIYQAAWWIVPLLIGGYCGFHFKAQYGTIALVLGIAVGLIPGVTMYFRKKRLAGYFQQLEQRIQRDASQIDNYLEQRVVILKNAAALLEKAVNLDKDTFTLIASLRSGNKIEDNAKGDEQRNELSETLDNVNRSINVAVENYPDLKAHQAIEDCLQQNSYLQKEITASRELYNDSVLKWNREIFQWPLKKIVAAKQGYTTRIPFIASKLTKEEARSVLF